MKEPRPVRRRRENGRAEGRRHASAEHGDGTLVWAFGCWSDVPYGAAAFFADDPGDGLATLSVRICNVCCGLSSAEDSDVADGLIVMEGRLSESLLMQYLPFEFRGV